jgi:aspartate/methionine/tyrosine aminotransferase
MCAVCAGQCLSKDNLAELIKFAYEQRIVLMADEVYQENIYQVRHTKREGGELLRLHL